MSKKKKKKKYNFLQINYMKNRTTIIHINNNL